MFWSPKITWGVFENKLNKEKIPERKKNQQKILEPKKIKKKFLNQKN